MFLLLTLTLIFLFAFSGTLWALKHMTNSGCDQAPTGSTLFISSARLTLVRQQPETSSPRFQSPVSAFHWSSNRIDLVAALWSTGATVWLDGKGE
ncbi:hypothetical protein B0T22DRAFT_464202 [Podospora appendiculata]|uniref:Secreted protein n=1 Tax=Podospora appendiculata TaxID=314037 RepID=A0AAE0X4F5_9PEZI|nr:hypothetical protein B0T22DRAFT_464202 [Podospora appendiculata]